jgi:hypothetical protein
LLRRKVLIAFVAFTTSARVARAIRCLLAPGAIQVTPSHLEASAHTIAWGHQRSVTNESSDAATYKRPWVQSATA